jgi:5,6,7,8-tetrahydromethanopterin hydro-lyase
VRGEQHERLTWGPAQAGVAAGIAGVVAADVIPRSDVDDLLLIAAVWVDWNADDDALVFENNRNAIGDALASAAAGLPKLDDVLAGRDAPSNPFFPGPA